MNITKHEKMYHIIRERVTGNFMKELLEMKPQKKQHHRQTKQLFQLYDYAADTDNAAQTQLQIDYALLQQHLKTAIDKEFNDYLCEFESSELKLQIFLLEKQMAIELDAIEVLQTKIGSYSSPHQPTTRHQVPLQISTLMRDENLKKTVINRQTTQQKYKMTLVPNMRVAIVPQNTNQTQVNQMALKQEELTELLRREIQWRTKQQQSTQNAANTGKVTCTQHEGRAGKSNQKTLKLEMPKHEGSDNTNILLYNDLMLCHRKILQTQTAWLSLRDNQQQSRKTKKKLQKLLSQFWQKAQTYQSY